MIFEIEEQQRCRFCVARTQQELLPALSLPAVLGNVSAREEIFIEQLVVHQLNAHLVSQREAPALVDGLGLRHGRGLRRLLRWRRRTAACGQHHQRRSHQATGFHALFTVSRPDLSSSAFISGSRPIKRRYSSAGSSLSPLERIFSRNSRPMSRLKMPCSRKRVKASASSTSAHLYE